MLADYTVHSDPTYLKHFRASHCNKNEGLFADAIQFAMENNSEDAHKTWGPVVRNNVGNPRNPFDLYGGTFTMTFEQLEDTVSLVYLTVCNGTAETPCRQPVKQLNTKELGLRRFTFDPTTGGEKQQTLDESMNHCLFGINQYNCNRCIKGLPPGQPCPQRTEKPKVLNFRNPNAVIIFNNSEARYSKEDFCNSQDEFKINGQRYQKLGAVLHHRGHFTAMYKRNGFWLSYDGLRNWPHNNKLRYLQQADLFTQETVELLVYVHSPQQQQFL